jgi:hypothetical protein
MKVGKSLRGIGYGLTLAILAMLTPIQDFDTYTAKKKRLEWDVKSKDTKEIVADMGLTTNHSEIDSTSIEEALEKYDPRPNMFFGKIPGKAGLDFYSWNRDSSEVAFRFNYELILRENLSVYGRVKFGVGYDSGETDLQRIELGIRGNF